MQIVFANSTETTPYLITVPGCGFRCTMQQFERFTNYLTSQNWEKECNENEFTQELIPVTKQSVFSLKMDEFINYKVRYSQWNIVTKIQKIFRITCPYMRKNI